MIFVDTNIIIDIAGEEGPWTAWSERALADAQSNDITVCNHIVAAELAVGFRTMDLLLSLLEALKVELVPLTDAVAFDAGRAHAEHRRRGGSRQAILADFLIGGHAVSLGARLLTRDRRRFAGYFPELTLITPETNNG